ncbi:MAG: hypothetical protein H7Z41_16830 [Cytophagales bacterium]|nr:hypothetical protein [Armatimonadota bacterium]
MPKIEKVTIHYSEKRTAAYQSVEHGLSLEVTLNEGESPKSVTDKYTPILRDMVTAITQEEIELLAAESLETKR